MSSEHSIYEIKDFSFQDGTTLPSARLAYLDLNPTATKTALVITCFRGRLNSTLTFANGALQTHRVIVVALFGNGESSSPSNTPEGFPTSIDYRDCVRAQRKLLTAHLGLESVDIIMGFSMGGQCTYYWTLMYPDFAQNAIIICSSARTSLHNYTFLEGPKAALQNSYDYINRHNAGTSKTNRGLDVFGKVYSGWLTSAEWHEKQMFNSLGFKTWNDWDRNVSSAGYVGWDPDDLLAKLNMWQKGDLAVVDASCGGSLEQALSLIKARVLLMPCRTDQYFTWEVSERESHSIPSAIIKVIPSIWGHIAGAGANPVDTNWMDETISKFLAKSL